MWIQNKTDTKMITEKLYKNYNNCVGQYYNNIKIKMVALKLIKTKMNFETKYGTVGFNAPLNTFQKYHCCHYVKPHICKRVLNKVNCMQVSMTQHQ